MDRRFWLKAALAMPAPAQSRWGWASAEGERIETVRGPISADELGLTLPHEHVLVDFIGADRASPDRYDPDEVVRVVLPHLERIRELGVRTFVECTPAHLGRDPMLLRRLSEATGLHLLTNTGLYNANGGKHLPEYARDGSADDLAARWIAEWKDGIGDTGIRPGLIKIGVDAGPLDDIDRKLVQAAARTHRATGLAIAAHTGDGTAAHEQLDVLDREGVPPSAFLWVHAQNEPDRAIHLRAAQRGAWVEFDGIAPDSLGKHVELVKHLRDRGQLARVLVSQDAGWYHVGEPGGGTLRPYDLLITAFLPALREVGFSEEEVRRLTIDNPRDALTVRPLPR